MIQGIPPLDPFLSAYSRLGFIIGLVVVLCVLGICSYLGKAQEDEQTSRAEHQTGEKVTLGVREKRTKGKTKHEMEI